MFNVFVTRYREPLIIWYAILLHTLWAIDMYLDPSSGLATAPYAIKILFGVNTPHLLFIGCVCAFTGMAAPNRIVSVLLIIPQYTLLFISAVGALKAIDLGHFADGVARSRMFIATDQEPAIIIIVLYTIAVIQIARSKR